MSLVQGNPIPFVVMYTVGNILAIMSSMFLAGPKRQWKNMTKVSGAGRSEASEKVVVPTMERCPIHVISMICVLCYGDRRSD